MKALRLLCLAPAISVAAAAQATISGTLSLDEAISLARTSSPAYLRWLNDREVVEAQDRFATSRFFPVPSLEFSTGGGPTHITSPEFSRSDRRSSSQVTLGLRLPILDDGGRMNTVRQNRLDERGVEVSLAQADMTLRADITRAYYAAVMAERGVQVEARALDKAETNLKDTQDRFRIVPRITLVDLRNAELAVARANERVARADDAAVKAKLQLLEQMGVRLDPEVRLDTVVPDPLDPRKIGADSLIGIAMRNNPEVRSAELAAERSTLTMRYQRSRRWRPSVSTTASYSRSLNQPDYGALFNPDLSNGSMSLGLSVGYGFPDWFSSASSVIGAEATASDQQLSTRGTRTRIERQVRNQLIDFIAASRALALERRAAEMAREIMSIAEEEMAAGKISFFEYQQYVDNAANAERQVLQERLNMITQQLNLEQTLGVPLGR
jgi:cobalt-zinc-cadmium efflux system outer membrane protein